LYSTESSESVKQQRSKEEKYQNNLRSILADAPRIAMQYFLGEEAASAHSAPKKDFILYVAHAVTLFSIYNFQYAQAYQHVAAKSMSECVGVDRDKKVVTMYNYISEVLSQEVISCVFTQSQFMERLVEVPAVPQGVASERELFIGTLVPVKMDGLALFLLMPAPLWDDFVSDLKTTQEKQNVLREWLQYIQFLIRKMSEEDFRKHGRSVETLMGAIFSKITYKNFEDWRTQRPLFLAPAPSALVGESHDASTPTLVVPREPAPLRCRACLCIGGRSRLSPRR